MGVTDFSLIEGVHVLILFSRVAIVNLEIGVESRHVGLFR